MDASRVSRKTTRKTGTAKTSGMVSATCPWEALQQIDAGVVVLSRKMDGGMERIKAGNSLVVVFLKSSGAYGSKSEDTNLDEWQHSAGVDYQIG